MKFTLFCGDAVPGCTARFEDESRDRILEQVVAHARSAHGVKEVTPDMLAAIAANIATA